MNNSIATINSIENLKPIGVNYNTGLEVYQSYQAASGFMYQVGACEMYGLIILIGYADGTACSLLSGIQVREKETGKDTFENRKINWADKIFLHLSSRTMNLGNPMLQKYLGDDIVTDKNLEKINISF